MTVIPVVDYEPGALAAGPQPPLVRREPTAATGICMPCAPARRSLRSVPPRGHVRRRRAAQRPRGDRPSPARHTVAADAVHRTHRLGGLLRAVRRPPVRVARCCGGCGCRRAVPMSALSRCRRATAGGRDCTPWPAVSNGSAHRRAASGRSSPFIWAEPCTWVEVLRAGPSSCGSWPPAGPPHAVPVGWVHPPSRPPRAAGRRRCAAPARNRPRTGRCR